MGNIIEMHFKRQVMTSDLWTQVLPWRNDPLVYRWSRTNGPIDFVEHVEWFAKRKTRLDEEPVYSYFHRGEFVGMARLDLITIDSYEVSLIVSPLHRGKGYGELILKDICVCFSRNMGRGFKLIAKVHSENQVSKRLFNKLNFMPLKSQESFIIYVYSQTSSDSFT
jgi:RimJ/RimL family protein N-acetyltransferase